MVLLGDGAGAAILSRRPINTEMDTVSRSNLTNICRELIDSVLKADGKGAKSLCIPEGGSCNPLQTSEAPPRNKLEMDGRAVYNFAVAANQEIICILLERKHLQKEDIVYIVSHQANERIIHAASRCENIALERFYINIASYTNTSSASILIEQCRKKGC